MNKIRCFVLLFVSQSFCGVNRSEKSILCFEKDKKKCEDGREQIQTQQQVKKHESNSSVFGRSIMTTPASNRPIIATILPATTSNRKRSNAADGNVSTTAATSPPPAMFSPEWFTHGRVLMMGLVGLAFIVIVCYGWWWLKGNQRLRPFRECDESDTLRSVWFYEYPLLQGRHFTLPRGAYELATLNLNQFGSIRVPAGFIVELHSITTLVEDSAQSTAATGANSTETKDGRTSTSRPVTTPAATESVAPPGYIIRPAPSVFVCRTDATTDVSYLEWDAVHRIVVRAV